MKVKRIRIPATSKRYSNGVTVYRKKLSRRGFLAALLEMLFGRAK